MEPYSDKEFSEKSKRALQILLYILEVKTGIRVKATNIRPSVWDKGAVLYFEIEVNYETSDPDVGAFRHQLNDIDNKLYDFFSKAILTPKADFKLINLRPKDSDDMVGLFMGVNFEWDGHENSNNTTAKFGYEYNLYYDEYDQYYDN